MANSSLRRASPSLYPVVDSSNMRFTQTVAAAGLLSATATAQFAGPRELNHLDHRALQSFTLDEQHVLLSAFNDAYEAEMAKSRTESWFGPIPQDKSKHEKHGKHDGKKPNPKGPKPVDIPKQQEHMCNKQCARTGAACSAACLKNVLSLNLGSLVPCFASCGTANAVCHKTVCASIEEDYVTVLSRKLMSTEVQGVSRRG